MESFQVVDARAEHLAAVAEAGRKKRSADAQVVVGYPYPSYGYAAYPYAIAPFAPLVAHPNGAVVPVEPKDVSYLSFLQIIRNINDTFLGC